MSANDSTAHGYSQGETDQAAALAAGIGGSGGAAGGGGAANGGQSGEDDVVDVTDVVEKEQRAAIEIVDLEDDTIDHAAAGPKTPAAPVPAASPSRTRVDTPAAAAHAYRAGAVKQER
eukprot:SAG22_NODE_1412_length_4477_cov_8.593878_2_plen_118_part_00